MLPQYESAALKALFDEEVLSNLHLDCDSLLEELSESEDILGLIVGLNSDKKSVFIHKSYEEFLAALWLSRNYQNHKYLMLLLFQKDYRNTRLMFDMLLTYLKSTKTKSWIVEMLLVEVFFTWLVLGDEDIR
ncbi:hypothetical protein GEV33_009521 [Tenebrio molitor]|uniref:Uncharacterized protein n=1 Tax=Tenebrio molitor TaxID=7067 RepID=A0A8J6HEM4_TENMO|nr:hypothetical protein GEV33_009521 [Tenebrio molitor]